MVLRSVHLTPSSSMVQTCSHMKTPTNRCTWLRPSHSAGTCGTCAWGPSRGRTTHPIGEASSWSAVEVGTRASDSPPCLCGRSRVLDRKRRGAGPAAVQTSHLVGLRILDPGHFHGPDLLFRTAESIVDRLRSDALILLKEGKLQARHVFPPWLKIRSLRDRIPGQSKSLPFVP